MAIFAIAGLFVQTIFEVAFAELVKEVVIPFLYSFVSFAVGGIVFGLLSIVAMGEDDRSRVGHLTFFSFSGRRHVGGARCLGHARPVWHFDLLRQSVGVVDSYLLCGRNGGLYDFASSVRSTTSALIASMLGVVGILFLGSMQPIDSPPWESPRKAACSP